MPLDPDMFDPVCPTDLMPIRIGDKWTSMIIRCLESGPRRFSELRVPLRRVTAKVLTQSLRAMERDGLLTRTNGTGPGRQTHYELTPLGLSLLEPLNAMCMWAEEHWDALIDAREASEGRLRASVRPQPSLPDWRDTHDERVSNDTDRARAGSPQQ